MPSFRRRVHEMEQQHAGRVQIGIAQTLHYLQTANGSVTSWELEQHSHLRQPQMSIILKTLLVAGWVEVQAGGFQEPQRWTWTGPAVDD